mgnify:CR=1 FL=1
MAPSTFPPYLDDTATDESPEETARAIDAEGWFHTGDMAIVRADGYMRFIGRYKDMLKSMLTGFGD